jgi:hypothetical protein
MFIFHSLKTVSENVAATAVEEDEESTVWKAMITGKMDPQQGIIRYDIIILY